MLLSAALQLMGQLSKGYFMPFALVCVASIARCRVLAAEALGVAIKAYNTLVDLLVLAPPAAAAARAVAEVGPAAGALTPAAAEVSGVPAVAAAAGRSSSRRKDGQVSRMAELLSLQFGPATSLNTTPNLEQQEQQQQQQQVRQSERSVGIDAAAAAAEGGAGRPTQAAAVAASPAATASGAGSYSHLAHMLSCSWGEGGLPQLKQMPFDPEDSLEARRTSCWALHGVSLVANPQAAAAGVGAQGVAVGAEAQTGEGLGTGLYGGLEGSGGDLGVKISREELLLLQQEQQQREGEAYQPAVPAPLAPPPSVAAGGGTAAALGLRGVASAPAAVPARPPPVVAIAGGWNSEDDSSDEHEGGSGGILGVCTAAAAAAATVGVIRQTPGPMGVGATSVSAPVAAGAAGGGSNRGVGLSKTLAATVRVVTAPAAWVPRAAGATTAAALAVPIAAVAAQDAAGGATAAATAGAGPLGASDRVLPAAGERLGVTWQPGTGEVVGTAPVGLVAAGSAPHVSMTGARIAKALGAGRQGTTAAAFAAAGAGAPAGAGKPAVGEGQAAAAGGAGDDLFLSMLLGGGASGGSSQPASQARGLSSTSATGRQAGPRALAGDVAGPQQQQRQQEPLLLQLAKKRRKQR